MRDIRAGAYPAPARFAYMRTVWCIYYPAVRKYYPPPQKPKATHAREGLRPDMRRMQVSDLRGTQQRKNPPKSETCKHSISGRRPSRACVHSRAFTEIWELSPVGILIGWFSITNEYTRPLYGVRHGVRYVVIQQEPSALRSVSRHNLPCHYLGNPSALWHAPRCALRHTPRCHPSIPKAECK